MAFRTLLTTLVCSSCLLHQAIQAPVNHDSDSLVQFTYPSIVDSHGDHLSYDLQSAHRQTRSTDSNSQRTYFKIDAFGQYILLNMTQYNDFLHISDNQGPIVEQLHSNGSTTAYTSSHSDCHHTGHVQSLRDMQSGDKLSSKGMSVTLSTCRGLHGVIATESGYLFIEPVTSDDIITPDTPTQHKVYRNSQTGSCSSQGDTLKFSRGESLPLSHEPGRRLKRASLVSEVVIETAVVADKTMLEEHGQEGLEAYLFTLMGMVHHLYRDFSIGHPITVVLVRTIILDHTPRQFSDSSSGHYILDDFCSWQKVYRESSAGPHFDVAVMITRKEICETTGSNCGTLGLADIKSMCNQARSCNVNKDTGLSTSFTIAHELGHNLGLRHDGDPQVECSSDPRYLMAPSFAVSLNPHMWSICSREQLANQLSIHERVSCLLNKPGQVPFQFLSSPILHGMEYSPTEQCRLQAGDNSTVHCPGMEDECHYLWCQSEEASKCTHQQSPPAPGTPCTLTSGKEGVCYQGTCHQYDDVIKPRDGGWGQWGEWSACSLTCGMGVQYSIRECDSPTPANGGQWCRGAKRRYQTCSILDTCPTKVNLRDSMCQDNPPIEAQSAWKSASLELIAYRGLDMCQYHCEISSKSNTIYSMMTDLPDGAPCITAHSKGVCVQGRCEAVSCEGVLGVPSYKDQCGVWCGQGDSCVRVSSMFNNITQRGTYHYYKATCIPEGATNIVVEEVTPSSDNYIIIDGSITKIEEFNLYVRREGMSKEFFTNSVWVYNRREDTFEYFKADGPIDEEVSIYLLANVVYPGIRYTYTIPKSKVNETCHPVHYWRAEDWSECVADCVWGEKTRAVKCVRLTSDGSTEQTVDQFLCDPFSKPNSTERCYTEPCVYSWTATEWTQCDAICGEGQQLREVTCEWTKRNGEKEIVNGSHCDLATKPASIQSCTVECVYEWATSEWSDCNVICGSGQQGRTVNCKWLKRDGTTEFVQDTFCAGDLKPTLQQTCKLPDCIYEWTISDWTKCSTECGRGQQERSIQCQWDKGELGVEVVADSHCNAVKPISTQTCFLEECVYQWHSTAWSECSVTICGDGQQTRTVACEWIRKTGMKEPVSDHYCTSPGPASTQDCHIDCVYEWALQPWSDCSVECGEGIQARTVTCEWVKGDQGRETVTDSSCNQAQKPDSTKTCRLEACVYYWSVSAWSECDVQYCGSGKQRRDVSCIWEKSDGSTVTVQDRLCAADTSRPAPYKDCTVDCVYQWASTPFGQCEGLCSQGEQSRQVSCKWVKTETLTETVTNEYCSSPKPPTTQTCPLADCRYVWVANEWGACDATCGEGWKTRTVVCHWEDLRISGHFNSESEITVSKDMCSVDSKPHTKTTCKAPKTCAPETPCIDESVCSYYGHHFCVITSIKERCCQLCS